ncbi:MAG: hypothetical protein ABI792_00870 [bacterium]
MKTIFTAYCFAIIFLQSFSLAPGYSFSNGVSDSIQTVVVPNVNAVTQATSSFLGPLANSDRTYQMLINKSQLTNLIGRDIKGFNFRSTATATTSWPTADVLFNNYTINLSESVAPANRSFTFANNVVGPQIQVRTGPLTIPANSYLPNSFGPDITFNRPYFYTGGHLLVEIRHTGFIGTSRSVEATGTSTAGYGTLFSATWTGDSAGTLGVQGNFSTIRFNSDIDYPTLNLSALIEGFYNGSTMVKDTVRVYLRNATTPFAVVDSAVSVLDSLGKGYFRFLNAASGVNYYLEATHRNSINTWSAMPVTFTGNELAYDFTAAASAAFGDNLKLKGSEWTIFSGDITRDGAVNLSDITAVVNAAASFSTGYIITDVTGDNVANLSDITIVFNNASLFVSEKRP